MTKPRNGARRTVRPPRKTEAQWRREVDELEIRVRRLEGQLVEQDRLQARRSESTNAHIGVLASDRDRLTAALEVATRRLASPSADRDPSRAGWRATRAFEDDK